MLSIGELESIKTSKPEGRLTMGLFNKIKEGAAVAKKVKERVLTDDLAQKVIKEGAAAAKKAKEFGSEMKTQVKERIPTDDLAQKVLEAVKQGLMAAGIKSAETLADETKFLEAVDNAHSYLPISFRILVPKRLLQRLMKILRTKMLIKAGELEFESGAINTVLSVLKEGEEESPDPASSNELYEEAQKISPP